MMFKKLKEYLYNKISKQRIASEAESLLQNDAFAIAVDTVQNNILSELVSTKLEDKERRELLFRQYKAVDDVLIELAKLINNADQPLPTETFEAESHQGDK